MKIGVITFFNNGNLGSELQAYSLKCLLTDMGHECIHIKPRERNMLNKLWVKFKIAVDVLLHSAVHPGIIKALMEINGAVKSIKKISQKSRNLISDFSDRNLNQAFPTYRELMRYIDDKRVDMFICGSDQVWSPLQKPFTQRYSFLNFVNRDRKLSYAASMGVNEVPNYSRKRVIKDIGDFKYISVREYGLAGFLKKDANLDAKVVVDPVLLHDREYWSKICNDTVMPKDKYVLCYFLGDISDEKHEFISEYAAEKGLSLIYLPYRLNFSDGEYPDCGPAEFVSYIKNAEFIFTDSFHCTVFSVIFHRQFIATNRSHVSIAKQTGRITDFLNMIGMERRYSEKTDALGIIAENVCDFENADCVICAERMKSIEFLTKSLKEIEENIND